MNREVLIAYAKKYSGEYQSIRKAINSNEFIYPVNMDNVLTIFDDDYPIELFDLERPPFVLFYKGDINLLKKEKIGIVGSRIACDYALDATRALCNYYKDKVIVSGLAKGIDACAHENAYKTIGVLGCGIDYIYPYSNYKLIKRIEKEGLIISEYPGMSKPLGYHFPFRNRIISALSDRIYVMQSSDKSGTMTTINEALELGKEIRVLPYNIFDQNGIQNNKLICEGGQPIEIDEIAF